MAELIIGAGAALLGATALRVGSALVRSLRQSRAERRQEVGALESFRERAYLVLAQAQPKNADPVRGWRGLRKFRVTRKVKEAADVHSLYLKPYDGKPVPLFVPGQHLTLQVHLQDQPKPLTRCYSLSDAPVFPDRYRITVKRLVPPPVAPDSPPGLVSSHLHEVLREGATLNVQAPSGQFYLDLTKDRPVVLIAGGVGITPLMSMLNAIHAFGRPSEAWLFYGLRNRLEHTFYDSLHHLDVRHDQVRQFICYSRPTRSCVKGRDYHHRGRVTIDLLRSLLPHNRFVFYICGPSGMLDDLTRGLRDWGVAEADIRTEAFGAAAVETMRSAEDQDALADRATALPVTFARSQKTVDWRSDDRVLLNLAERSGVTIYSGCRAGQCGSCMALLTSGKVQHIVKPGVPLAEGFCLPCIAVPESPVVLDA